VTWLRTNCAINFQSTRISIYAFCMCIVFPPTPVNLWLHRRNIRLIEGSAKCRHLKKLACKRDFAAGVYLSETQNPPPPPTLYLFTQGRGGGELNQRDGVRGFSSQSWVENTNHDLQTLRNTLQSINSYETTLFWPECKAPFYRFISAPDSNPDPKR
jgi:hypothetical protein